MVIKTGPPTAPMPGATDALLLVDTLPMITPIAPAFSAFFTLSMKLHVPLSMKAIFPAIEPAFETAEQASNG
jgi:hypothetical protein